MPKLVVVYAVKNDDPNILVHKKHGPCFAIGSEGDLEALEQQALFKATCWLDLDGSNLTTINQDATKALREIETEIKKRVESN